MVSTQRASSHSSGSVTRSTTENSRRLIIQNIMISTKLIRKLVICPRWPTSHVRVSCPESTAVDFPRVGHRVVILHGPHGLVDN